MTFSDALHVLRTNNESIGAAVAALNESKEQQGAARGLFFPRLTASGRYSRIDDPITIDLHAVSDLITTLHGLPAGTIPPFELSVQDDEFWQADLSLTWSLFTGGRILAVNRAADAQVQSTQAQVLRTESALISELARSYFGLHLARQAVNLHREVCDAMARHLQKAQKLEQAGMLARVERLHAEVAHAEAQRTLQGAIRDVYIAQASLNNLLSLQDSITAVSPLFIPRHIHPVTHFQKRAREQSPLLKQAAMHRVIAHENYRKEVGAFSPTLYLFGTRKLYTKDSTILEPDWVAGIGMDMTLFDGFSRSRKVNAARYKEQQVRYREKKIYRDVETLVDTLYHTLMKAREQFETSRASRASAEEYCRVRNRAFEAGYATSLDVVDARLALSRVKLEQLTAVYIYDVTLAALLEASGCSGDFETYMAKADTEDIS